MTARDRSERERARVEALEAFERQLHGPPNGAAGLPFPTPPSKRAKRRPPAPETPAADDAEPAPSEGAALDAQSDDGG